MTAGYWDSATVRKACRAPVDVRGLCPHLMRVTGPLRPLAFVLLFAVAASAHAAHTKASLVLNVESARPGDTVTAGIRLVMEPGWHTYWENSGGSGMPTTIDWELPPGFSAAPVWWPVPEKLLE